MELLLAERRLLASCRQPDSVAVRSQAIDAHQRSLAAAGGRQSLSDARAW